MDHNNVIKSIPYNSFSFDIRINQTPVHLFDSHYQELYLTHFHRCKDENESTGFTCKLFNLDEVFTFMIHQDSAIMLYIIAYAEETSLLFEELIKINNEQVRSIRALYKKLADKESNSDFLEEIMHVNNELINTKRQLSKKNMELNELNLRLENLNYTDYLTNIPNRRKFFKDIYQFALDADYYLVMMDFNNFKIINDEFGHIKGDETLRFYTQYISDQVIPRGGVIYRLGGDEFAILVEKESAIDFKQLFENVDKELRKIHPLTGTSYGIVEVTKDNCNENHKAELLMAKADHFMYKMKKDFYDQNHLKMRTKKSLNS